MSLISGIKQEKTYLNWWNCTINSDGKLPQSINYNPYKELDLSYVNDLNF